MSDKNLILHKITELPRHLPADEQVTERVRRTCTQMIEDRTSSLDLSLPFPLRIK